MSSIDDSDSISEIKQHSPALFNDVESKTEESKTKFEEIPECTYSSKHIGDSGQNEHMTCDCFEDWDTEERKNLACGEDSDCINRVTSVECINKYCSCGKNCQNQRFQKKQYSKVSVFQTDLKGYGLKADETITESSFIYEYIGDVIDETIFRKRMVDYDQKHFKHFYFMMLTKDAFIDATVKGSLARFVNHSCNPNAYVDKWVVGDKLRMGIFAKRFIAKGEEITFDYNVDRYGAQSQPCYCGEPNCIKFMGGKTQTDAALLLPEGISEALGVTHKQEKQWLKENKHLRSRQQSDDSVINESFVKSINVQPIQTTDVSKIMGALMKAQDLYIIKKLIERINLTNDSIINSIIVKFHGYKTLSKILKDFKDFHSNEDEELNEIKDELIETILNILTKWPKVTRNKIESSQIEDVVKDISKTNKNEEIINLTKNLLDDWGKLQMAYRIPKNLHDGDKKINSRSPSIYGRGNLSPNEVSNQNSDIEILKENNDNLGEAYDDEENPLPEGWQEAIDPNTNTKYYFHMSLGISKWERPTSAVPRGPKGPNLSKLPKGPRGPPVSAATLPKGPRGRNDSKIKDPRFIKSENNEGNLNGSGNSSNDESILRMREEERLKREKEEQFKELRDKEKLLQDYIIQSQKEVELKQKEADRLKQERIEQDRERRRKRGISSSSSSSSTKKPKPSSSSNHTSSSHHHGSSRSDETNEIQWRKIFAKYVPNLIKKHEKEIGRENIKGCAKELVNILTVKEIKKHQNQNQNQNENGETTSQTQHQNKIISPPKEFDNIKIKKLKDFCNIFMEKFLAKYRMKRELKKKLNVNGGNDDGIKN